MKKQFVLLFCIFCSIASIQTLEARAEPLSKRLPDSLGFVVQVGDTAPDFSIQLDNGTVFKLSAHRGSLVMLQFTASWCGVCREEMPFIESDIWQKHKDSGLVLIGLDRDEPLDKLKQLRQHTKITYPLGLDTNADVFSLYADKKSGVTRNVLVNEKGLIIQMTRLYNPSEFELLKKRIDNILDKKQ